MTTPIPTLPTLATAATVAATSALLTACGGGGDDPGTTQGSNGGSDQLLGAQALTSTTSVTQQQAWRFLDQATMGPTVADISLVQGLGYAAWLTQQFGLPPSSYSQHAIKLMDATNGIAQALPFTSETLLQTAWFKNAVGAQDQLRQRVVMALSEIMVISTAGGLVESPLICASYLDFLAKNAFGSFRNLLADVSRHPAMGRYLTHFGNSKPANGSHPDQNYAREVMQLFSIGIYMLDMYGHNVLGTNNKPLPAYNNNDIIILSHVFTGWSYPASAVIPAGWPQKTRKFNDDWDTEAIPMGNVGFNGWVSAADPRQTVLMEGWSNYHATQNDLLTNPELLAAHQVTGDVFDGNGNVKLLGQWFKLGATPQASLDAALNIFMAHQNIAPFIAKQMIQRLVTSNPSDGFVYRASTAFKNSSFNLKTLISTILQDTEARNVPTLSTAGKIREPLLRLTHLLRALGNKSKTGDYLSVDVSGLGQVPLKSPSVFNFFRPGFRAPNTEMAKQGKVAPEMQITNETTVANYINRMHDFVFDDFGMRVALDLNGQPLKFYPAAIQDNPARYKAWLDGVPYVFGGISHLENTSGAKTYQKDNAGNPIYVRDITLNVSSAPSGATATSAGRVDWVNLYLMGNTMSADLKTALINFDSANTGATDADRAKRLAMAVLVSPEYLVQK
jgi:uncharacterized protein (DUF1800 family)